MEIDQKEPFEGYTDNNCVSSCYWCNNAKTDEFDVQEFKEIARGIYKAWSTRLPTAVYFPEETYL